MKKHICEYCGKEYKNGQSLGGHIILCKKNPNNYIETFKEKKAHLNQKRNPLKKYLLKCEMCEKEYEIELHESDFNKGKYRHTCSRHCASILTASKTNIEDKNKKLSGFYKNKHLENGKWVVNEENYKKFKIETCKYCGKEFIIEGKTKSGKLKSDHFCSSECKHKFLSELSKKSSFGGYVPNSIKKHKKGNFNGIHCDSSWELAYLVYCIEHNIPIKRCNEKREYTLNGKIHNYYPDFIINNNQIIEIKGYYDTIAKEKEKQNPDIIVLQKNKLKNVFEYVENKYGKNFWEILYE